MLKLPLKKFSPACFLGLFLSALFFGPTTNSLQAQLKLEDGEEVKVPYLGDWHDGVVVQRDKKQYLVDFTWGSSHEKTKVFDRNSIRKLYEYEAIDFGRRWETADGAFKIEAAMLRFGEDTVTLFKPDMNLVTVPLDRLCTRDTAYVKKFKKQFLAAVKRGQVPDWAPELPELETFEGSSGSMSTFAKGSDSTVEPLGQIPSYLKEFTQNGMGFDKIRSDQKLISVIPVGGPEQIVLASFRERNSFNSPPFFQSQLYWVSLKNKRMTKSAAITHEDFVLDYDPRYKLLLTFNDKDEFFDLDEPDHYTIWKLSVNDDKPEALVRWEAKGLGWSSHKFGKIVNQSTVIVQIDGDTYEGFDFVNKKSLYTIKPQSFFSPPSVISPDRKHLIIPEDGQVSVADAATGEITMTLPVADRHVSGANINPAGNKLAAITERNVYVWDLESSSNEPTVYPAPLMGSPFSARIEWIGDDHVLGESHRERILYQLSLKLPVWSFEMDVSHYFLNKDPMKNMVVDGKFFYVAQPDFWGASIAIGAVELLSPQINEITQNIDRDSLMILKKGISVGIEMKGTADTPEIESTLKEKIAENGWTYDPNAEIKIHAFMGTKPSQSVTYENRETGKRTTVNFKPHFARLQIMKGSTIIWQSGTSTGVPSFVRTGDIQKEVNRYQAPQVNFFKTVKIDTEIIDPKYSRGFGKSKLGLRGVQIVSSTPPGREDDPLAAVAQANEDMKKAEEEEKEREKKQRQSNGVGSEDADG